MRAGLIKQPARIYFRPLGSWWEDALQRDIKIESEVRHHVVMWLIAAGWGERLRGHHCVPSINVIHDTLRRRRKTARGTWDSHVATIERGPHYVRVDRNLRFQKRN